MTDTVAALLDEAALDPAQQIRRELDELYGTALDAVRRDMAAIEASARAFDLTREATLYTGFDLLYDATAGQP